MQKMYLSNHHLLSSPQGSYSSASLHLSAASPTLSTALLTSPLHLQLKRTVACWVRGMTTKLAVLLALSFPPSPPGPAFSLAPFWEMDGA